MASKKTPDSAGLQPGDKAPAIEALTDENKPFSLAALAGKQVILYFYPKADTPG